MWTFLQMGPSLWRYFYTFHPEPVYFSRLFLAGYKEKSLCDHCAWLGHSRLELVAPWRFFVGFQNNSESRGGPPNAHPLCAGLVSVFSDLSPLLSWYSWWRSVEPQGWGRAAGSCPTLRQALICFRDIWGLGQHYLWSLEPLHYDPVLFGWVFFVCFSIEIYNYPFLGCDPSGCGEGAHTRTSHGSCWSAWLSRGCSLLISASPLGNRRAEWMQWRFGSQRGAAVSWACLITWMNCLFLIFLLAVVISKLKCRWLNERAPGGPFEQQNKVIFIIIQSEKYPRVGSDINKWLIN